MRDLEACLSAAALDWLRGIKYDDKHAVLAAFSGAARRVGRDAVAVTDRGTWSADEVARAVIVLRGYPSVTPDEVWAHADNRERQALLKVLPMLPSPEWFTTLAVEACRSNVLTVFEAIACENPYPSLFFDELAWNQMVLKAAFNGVQLIRIAGLEERCNPELARMAEDFAAERRAAGRPVPDDLGLVTKGIVL